MHNLEILLIAIILIFPIVDLINEKYKSNNKILEYIKIACFMWIPTLLLIYLYSNIQLSVLNLKLEIINNWQNILVGSLLCLGIIYLFFLIQSIKSNAELRSEITEKFEAYKDLMPVSKNETLVFTLVVSVTAGICEELLFRAYLFNLIDSHIGIFGAIILSSVVFGFWHIYLGWQEVIRTGIMGVALCGIYIFTGSIILPILIHIFVDVYSGLLSYFSMRKPSNNSEIL